MAHKSKQRTESPLFAEEQLRDATNLTYWERGEAYFAEGRVGSIMRDGESIVAKVKGTRNYTVTLSAEGGEVQGECTCPLGDEGAFCKHCVAVGLAHLQTNATGGRKASSLDDARQYLASKDPAELVEIIVEQMREDSALRRRILTQAEVNSAGGANLSLIHI